MFPFSHCSTVRGSTHVRASIVFTLNLHKRLIDMRDRTAIIDRFRCRVEETSFREAMSDGEAQPTIVQTR